MPHFCLKLRAIAKNGTKAHPPKNPVLSPKTHTKNTQSSTRLAPDRSKPPPQRTTHDHRTRPISPPRCKIPREKPHNRHEVARFGSNLLKCAGFCRFVRIFADLCRKVHESAKNCRKLLKTTTIHALRTAHQKTHINDTENGQPQPPPPLSREYHAPDQPFHCSSMREPNHDRLPNDAR